MPNFECQQFFMTHNVKKIQVPYFLTQLLLNMNFVCLDERRTNDG